MTAIERLQQRLSELPDEQREAMAAQILDEWEALEWDRQIEADAQAGKLDKLIGQSKGEPRPAQRQRHDVAETVDGLIALSNRLTLGEDVSTRDLIEDGRRM